ncbi:hypothetical protein [Spirosoma arboris]|nr:hypothetical protein [Spirosoma arboris]
MHHSHDNQNFRLFKELLSSSLFALNSELESFRAMNKLKARVKKLRGQWPELSVTIEKELGELGHITRYTYLQIEDFIVELNEIKKILIGYGLHQWANKASRLMNNLDEMLQQNSHLFLSTERALRQSGYIKYLYDDNDRYYNDVLGVRTSIGKIVIQLTEDGLIIKTSGKRYKQLRVKSKMKNDTL